MHLEDKYLCTKCGTWAESFMLTEITDNETGEKVGTVFCGRCWTICCQLSPPARTRWLLKCLNRIKMGVAIGVPGHIYNEVR